MDLRSLLGTELPVIQAPMAGVQDSALATAVSEADALWLAPLRDARPRCDAELTKPY